MKARLPRGEFVVNLRIRFPCASTRCHAGPSLSGYPTQDCPQGPMHDIAFHAKWGDAENVGRQGLEPCTLGLKVPCSTG